MPKIEAIVADSDGTLVDTVDLIRHGQHETATRYLAQHGVSEEELPDFDTYNEILTKMVGGSARNTLEQTVRELYKNSPHHLTGVNFDDLHSMLNPVQDELAPEYVKAYEGLADFLRRLGDMNVQLAVFTSGTPHHIVRNLGIALPELNMVDLHKDKSKSDEEKLQMFEQRLKETFGLEGFTVVTEGDVINHKPAPDSLHLAAKRLGVATDAIAVLGDHKVDMQAAVNAGIATRIGITHGFDNGPTLRENGATHIVHSLGDVNKIIK